MPARFPQQRLQRLLRDIKLLAGGAGLSPLSQVKGDEGRLSKTQRKMRKTGQKTKGRVLGTRKLHRLIRPHGSSTHWCVRSTDTPVLDRPRNEHLEQVRVRPADQPRLLVGLQALQPVESLEGGESLRAPRRALVQRASASNNARSRSRKSGFIGRVRMCELVKLEAQLPHVLGALRNGNVERSLLGNEPVARLRLPPGIRRRGYPRCLRIAPNAQLAARLSESSSASSDSGLNLRHA